MFDLDQAMSDWRRRMAASGIKSSKVLDELEGHLREDIRALASDGTPEVQAFRLAVSRLGCTDSLSIEFKKLSDTSSIAVKIGALLWTGLSTALAARLLMGVIAGNLSVLLSVHVFSLTAGYAAAFLNGGFGIYCVSYQWFRAWSSTRQQSLSRAVLLFSRLSVGLVLAGLLLGMCWSGQNRGGYFAGGPREVGTLGASVWLFAFWLIQESGQVSHRVTMLLCIVGNVIVSLAWFGTGIVAHGGGMASDWPLDALLGVHLFFFTMAVVPIFKTAEA
jgi:hypothetical protein